MSDDRLWVQCPLLAFDTETSGPRPEHDRVVTAFLAAINLVGTGAEVHEQNFLLNPEIDIPEEASAIHGVTTEMAQRDGDEYEAGMLAIWASIQLGWSDGRLLAAYNASFDITIMCSELRRMGYEPGEIGPIVDPFVLDRHVDQYRKGSRKLESVADHYGVKLGDAHQADADAMAAARLAWKLPRVYPTLAKLTVGELQDLQRDSHKARQESFIAYLTRQNKDASDVSTYWPVRTAA